jgi:hypothetical protein
MVSPHHTRRLVGRLHYEARRPDRPLSGAAAPEAGRGAPVSLAEVDRVSVVIVMDSSVGTTFTFAA